MISARKYDDGRLELWDDGSPTHLVDQCLLQDMAPAAHKLFHEQYEQIGYQEDQPFHGMYTYRRRTHG